MGFGIESEIELQGEKYRCKATFGALVSIEKEANCSLPELFARYVNRNIRVNDVCAIIFYCMKAADPKMLMTYEDVGEKIIEHGYNRLLNDAFGLIQDCLTGTEKKKEEPVKK